MADPTEFRYLASGMSFAALRWGPDDGPLALCLHGYPDTAWTWRHLGPALADHGWRVVAPFMRGYAPTDLAPDNCYQTGALARDANEAHAALGGDDRAVLIGHDWGAVAAYGAAAQLEQPWRRIVTLAIPPLASLSAPPRSGSEAVRSARQFIYSSYMLYQQLPVVSERSLDRLIPFLWRRWSPGYDCSEDVRRVFEALDSPARRTAALRYYRALFQPWCRSREYAAEQSRMLKRQRCPVLALHGADDGCMQATYAASGRPFLPDGSEASVVPGAGHFLQLERPEEINARISAWLSAGGV
jgi:pimeloyl-ACP methyl ester carboxylesterase